MSTETQCEKCYEPRIMGYRLCRKHWDAFFGHRGETPPGPTAVEVPADDPVEHPGHYIVNGFEVIDIIEAFGLDYLEGNVAKYLFRWRKKNGLEDLKKAAWYLNRLVAREEGKK